MRYEGVAYRAHDPRWSWSPLSGEGAHLFGSRFNPKGVAALYLSLEWETAVAEASQGFPYRIPPLTIVSYDVDCEDVVDLTVRGALARYGAKRGDLACAWRLLAETGRPVHSWRLAVRLRGNGAAGVIVPSFAPGAAARAKNLVLWQWGERRPHRVSVIDPERRLPRDDSSSRR